MSTIEEVLGQNWDNAYAEGKFALDGPHPFAQEAIRFVQQNLPAESRGLDIGCGNGRDLVPMAEAGLHIDGIDLSHEGIEQIEMKLPHFKGKLMVGNFHELAGEWDYVVSMQVFEYGTREDSFRHFRKAAELLRPGGYLFLRVHAASTQLKLDEHIIEGEAGRSRTVYYGKDSDRRVPIHYFEQAELESFAAQSGFSIVLPPREDQDTKPKGLYSYWETTWQKPYN